jgi:predicted acyl esterase
VHRRLLCLALALAATLAVSAPSFAAEIPEGYAYSDGWFEAHDGVQLHAGVFLPKDRKPGETHPTIMVIGPYTAPNNGVTGATAGGPNAEDVPVRFPELFEDAKILKDRWAYVQVDARGFGGSGGCFEYYGPNEMRDTGTAVDWAAAQPWSTGRVATWGKSYDGADSLLAVAARPKGLAAAVIQAPGLSAYTALWHNGVHYGTGRYGTTPLYTVDDLTPGQNATTVGSPEYAAAAADAFTQNPMCRVDSIALMNTERDRSSDFWKDREPYRLAAGATTPVLWTHGFFDANTKPVHLDVFSALRGDVHAWFGQFTHLRGHEAGVGRRGFLEEAMRFLDRHVRGVRTGTDDPAVTIQEGNGKGRWRQEEQWPPADASPWSLPLRGGSYTDGPGNTGDGDGAGNGLWTLTKPLPHDVHLAGEPVVRGKLLAGVPDVNVVVHLYDVDPKGQARLVNRGATVAGAREFNDLAPFALYPQDWVFERGHRIGVVVSGADDDWYTPGVSNTEVGVVDGTASIALPVLRYQREEYLAGGPSESITDARPFAVPADALSGAVVETAFPPPLAPRPGPPLPPPAVSMPAGAPAASRSAAPSRRRARRAARATLRLRILRRGKRRLLRVAGRAPRARRVRVVVRFGRRAVARRTVRVRRGAYRATISLARLRRGRLAVSVRLDSRGRPLVAGIRLR